MLGRAANCAAAHATLAAQWAEFRDAKHDLFVQTGGDVLLLEGGSMDTLLLTDSPGGYGGAAEEEDEAM